MFPIDSETGSYNQAMLDALEQRIAGYGFPWKLKEVLPEVLSAGERAGVLTEEGARLLDPTGSLKAGIPLCPPEGDAGTGMVATNAVRPRTGNVSAGTSIFAMLVLERGLRQAHAEIDMVTTPDGAPVAMVHCNNCTSELNAWAALFHEFAQAAGTDISDEELYPLLFRKAMEGEPTCGGVLSCCYLSGEPISGLESGRPLLVRRPDSRLTLGNFMRSQLFATVAALKTGLDLLFQKESVSIDRLTGHGGLFKTPEVGQRILAAAAGVPVSVMETAGEGGAWGIALLAQYMLRKGHAETLAEYLEQEVFREMSSMEIAPSPEEQSEFTEYMKAYHHLLAVERAAVEQI